MSSLKTSPLSVKNQHSRCSEHRNPCAQIERFAIGLAAAVARCHPPEKMPPSTPRAKGDGEKEAKGDKKPAAKPKAKKPKGSAAPAVPMDAPKVMITADLDEAGAKSSLDELQKQYAALVVSFNNQQTELLSCQAQLLRAENELEVYRSAGESGGGGASVEIGLKRELEKMAAVRVHLSLPGLRRR